MALIAAHCNAGHSGGDSVAIGEKKKRKKKKKKRE